MCKAMMPEWRRPPTQNKYINNNSTRTAPDQTKRVRHIKHENDRESTEYSEVETDQQEKIDAEAALCMKQIIDEWANVNLIRQTTFYEERNSTINTDKTAEFWVATNFDNEQIHWFADTGSQRSFMNLFISIAQQLVKKTSKARIIPYNNSEKYRCFKNQQNNITSILQMDLESGSWNATNRQVLLVEKKTQNVMGHQILLNLKIALTANRNSGKKTLNVTESMTGTNIIK